MPARTGDTVAVHYTGTLEDGTVFDTSEGRAPLLFTIGIGDVIPGFEHAVVGLELGGSATVTIEPEDAYGPYYDEAVQEVSMDVFGEGGAEVGAQFSVIADDGSSLAARVIAVSDDMTTATVDFNHPLAGKRLTFAVSLEEILESAPGTTAAGEAAAGDGFPEA